MTDELEPHQLTGGNFLAPRGFAIIADDPGLGKTATAIHGADIAGARKILVLCPAVVREHWCLEFLRWQQIPRFVTVAEGHPKVIPGDGVTIVAHDALSHKPSMHLLACGFPYDLIIVDELHVFRQFGASRTSALMDPESGMCRWTKQFWGLTGTPLVNSAADIWPFFYGPLKGGVIWWDFCQRYTEIKTGFDGPTPTGVKNAAELAGFLRPYVLRRTSESVGLELPPLYIENEAVPVAPETMISVMADLEAWSPQRLMAALDMQDELRDSALARVRRTLGIAKVRPTADHVHNLIDRGCGPVVVFFQHTDMRKMLFDALHHQFGYKVSWIDGKITRAQLKAAQSWFQAGRIDVLLVQTQAGGMGLTLTQANRTVVAEMPWTAVGLWQAIKRVHRITQTRAVTAEILRGEGCWLEDILASVVGKKQRASNELLNLLVSNE